MQDIRLVGNDGEYLNLETQSGEKFRLVLDDSIRAAVRRDFTHKLDSVSISPREIQDAIRAGATADEVARDNSVPIDYVEKFALTVVDEIGHIVASARTVRIAVAEQRYSDATQQEFGEIVSQRVISSGGSEIEWSATKSEGSPWQVVAKFETKGESTAAIWSFDQRKLALSPENEVAVRLSNGALATVAPARHITESSIVSSDTIVIPIVTELDRPGPAAVEEEIEPIVAPVSSIEKLTRLSVEIAETQGETKEVEEATQNLTETADLLAALRKKKAAAVQIDTPASPEPEEAASELLDDPVSETVIPTAAQAPKKGRPSMPSWDEIVFGTKAED